jgi:hypothetical protein
MPRYKTLRVREEDFEKLKDVQRFLRRKGTDTINWTELRDQDVVDLPEDDDEDSSGDLAAGVVIGLGAAALAYLVIKGLQARQQEASQ